MDYTTAPADCQRVYCAARTRYDAVSCRPLGRSGLKVNTVTIGTWQNFGGLDARESVRELYLTAFDNGLFTFDFGNNYGRPPGSAEAMFGSFLADELRPYRRELVIATKAGYDMWPGPNGVGSSLKYLITSLDDSLKRLGLEYVDVFFSHRYDPDTPLEETAEALDFARRSGRCLYVGISSYPAAAARIITAELEKRGTPVIVNQSHYNILTRWAEDEVLDVCRDHGTGFTAFSPLAQGLLTDKYRAGLSHGRAAQNNSSVYCNDWPKLHHALTVLGDLAQQRGQSVAQMALSWVLRHPVVSSAVIGVRTPEQIREFLSLDPRFTAEEEDIISAACQGIDVDLWREISSHR